MEAIDLIRTRVAWCESEKVEILCCPETILGGLADNAARPADFAIDVESGQLRAALRHGRIAPDVEYGDDQPR